MPRWSAKSARGSSEPVRNISYRNHDDPHHHRIGGRSVRGDAPHAPPGLDRHPSLLQHEWLHQLPRRRRGYQRRHLPGVRLYAAHSLAVAPSRPIAALPSPVLAHAPRVRSLRSSAAPCHPRPRATNAVAWRGRRLARWNDDGGVRPRVRPRLRPRAGGCPTPTPSSGPASAAALRESRVRPKAR